MKYCFFILSIADAGIDVLEMLNTQHVISGRVMLLFVSIAVYEAACTRIGRSSKP